MSKTYRLSLYVTVPQTPVRPENSVRVCRVSNGRNIRGDREAGVLPREFGSPWFRFPTNAAGTVRTACECAYFRASAASPSSFGVSGITPNQNSCPSQNGATISKFSYAVPPGIGDEPPQ